MKLSRLFILVILLVQGLFAHGAEVWQRSYGPGVTQAKVFAGDGSTLYVGTSGGVFKSTDKGATWTAVNAGLVSTAIRALLLAPDGTLYAGTDSGGVYKSTNKGGIWTAANGGVATKMVNALARTPNGTLYAATDGGVFRSTDKGATWTIGAPAVSGGDFNIFTNALALAPDGTLYAGTEGYGVFISTDKGATFAPTNVNFGFVKSLALAPDGTLYAGKDKGLYKSTDKGVTWTDASGGYASLISKVEALFVAPDGTLYAGMSNWGVYRSMDRGTTWTQEASSKVSILTIFVAPDGVRYVGTSYGVYRSAGKGLPWTTANVGLLYATSAALMFTPDGTLYAGTSNGVFVSSNKGLTWAHRSDGMSDSGVRSLVYAPDGTLYAATDDYYVYRSTDKGMTWTNLQSGLPATARLDAYAMHVSALTLALDGTLYAGTGRGAFRSADKGTTWTAVNSGLTVTVNNVTYAMPVAALTSSPDGTLYAGTAGFNIDGTANKGGSVYRSTNKGATWIAANSGLTDKYVFALTLAPDGTLYAGTWGDGVFKSVDKGVTWTAANGGLTNKVVLSLALAPDGTLYAGTLYGGTFRSADKGATWTAASNGLTDMVIYALTFSQDGTLYAGTWGNGVQSMIRTAGKLTGLALQSPASLPENASATLQAAALYDNDYRQTVKPVWRVDNPAAASISADGTLTALAVPKDTVVTVTAGYSEGGVTQNASRQVVIKNVPAPLTALQIRSTANMVTSGGATALNALALYQDGTSSPVVPVWRVASGPAAIGADGVLTAQAVTADAPVTVTATYSEGALTKTATLTLTVKKPVSKLTFLKIRGADDAIGGQVLRYQAFALYEDGTEVEVTPIWTSQDPLSPISATGELSVDNATKQFGIVANYSEYDVGKTFTKMVTVTKSSAAPNTLKVKISQTDALKPKDMLEVDWSFENFAPTTRFDLYAWVVTPDNVPIYMINGGGLFDLPSFDIQKIPYRTKELLPQERRPMLHFPIPAGLASGVYTFHAVATKPGASVDDQSQWVSADNAAVTVR